MNLSKSKLASLASRPAVLARYNAAKVPVSVAADVARTRSLCRDHLFNPKSPNQAVRDIAITALERLRKGNVLPTLINATGDESLLFEFSIGGDSYSLDFYNSGEIVLLKRVRGEVLSASEFDQGGLEEAISNILDA